MVPPHPSWADKNAFQSRTDVLSFFSIFGIFTARNVFSLFVCPRAGGGGGTSCPGPVWGGGRIPSQVTLFPGQDQGVPPRQDQRVSPRTGPGVKSLVTSVVLFRTYAN